MSAAGPGMAEPCIHDLDPASCSVCNGADRRAKAADRRDLGPLFAARYDSACPGCGTGIAAGDEIRSDGAGGWICASCGDGP